MYDIEKLNNKKVTELREIAEKLNISKADKLKKQELVYKILDEQALKPSTEKDKKETNNFANTAKEINFPLEVLVINDEDAFKLYEYCFVIIRPDLMVAWRSDNMPENSLEVLDIIRGSK